MAPDPAPDQMASTGTIERELHIAASPEIVFCHLVDPDRAQRWLGDRAELEPVPGGLFRVTIAAGIVARGAYVAVEQDRRVVFTWGWEGDWNPVAPGSSTVEIELEPSDDGTLLRLRHTGLPAPQLGFHRWGWKLFLPRLESVSIGEEPEPHPLREYLDGPASEV